jgi:probable O-glycosylation ligase (exosortase A-associated)
MRKAIAPAAIAAPATSDERLGLPFILTLVYVVVEYARPANPMKIPLIISILLLVNWITAPEKRWSPQASWFLVLLAVIAVTGPFALNTYAALWGFVAMVTQLVFICIPMMTFLSSLRRLTIFINTLLVVLAYIALYGLFHAGQGPGGHIGDENDLALALNMVIPYAYMSIFLAEDLGQRLLYLGTFGLMVATVIGTFSRGGFLGLVAMLAFCLLMSPKKRVAVTVALVLSLGIVTFAPSAYWDRVSTIADEASDHATGTGFLRRQFWAIAREMFYQNPAFGVGFKNFQWNIDQYESAEQRARVGRSFSGMAAHSVYFTVLAELGLAGAIVFVTIIGYDVRDMRRVVQWCARLRHGEAAQFGAAHDAARAEAYARAMQASLIGFLVSGAFLSAFDYPHFWVLTSLIVALKYVTADLVQAAEPTRATIDRDRVTPPHVQAAGSPQTAWWQHGGEPYPPILER